MDNLVNPIIQESEGKKNHYIQGVFAQADTPNRNKRTYPLSIMEREINRFQELIEAKRAIGELNHPQRPNVDPERASHLIQELSFDENNVVGKAKILSTPVGNIVKSLLDDGVQLGVSTRGLGTVKPNKSGINEVQSDFILNTIDVVADPSGIDCWVNGIMENAEWIFKDGQWVVAEQIQSIIRKATPKQIAENQAKWFDNFLKSL